MIGNGHIYIHTYIHTYMPGKFKMRHHYVAKIISLVYIVLIIRYL
jgi:hypothetical protein